MQPRGVLGSSVSFNRRFKVGANFAAGQVVVLDASNLGQLGSPANNANSTTAVGIVLDASPPTYSTTKATGANTADRYVNATYHPFQLFSGRYSNTAAAYAAPAAELNGVILTASGANAGGLLVADTNVGTANYAGGTLLCLSGNAAGQSRRATTHSANTSLACTVPFDTAIAANDTFARLPSLFQSGILFTNDYKDFMSAAAGAQVGAATVQGGCVVFDIEVSDASGAMFSLTPQGGYEGGRGTSILSPSAPVFNLVSLFLDHAFNKRL